MRQGTKPTTVDEYLAALTEEKQATLEKLRKSIRSVVPEAEECISYGLPAFRLDGRVLFHIGAAARHCAFYAGAYPIKLHADELKRYDVSKGTIRFSAGDSLPATLVRKLVKARVAEHAMLRPARSAVRKKSGR